MASIKSLKEVLFLTSDGKYVIAQRPNALLLSWLGVKIASYLPVFDEYRNTMGDISTVLLLVWALLELFAGVNLFRKLLGLTVTIFLLARLAFSV